MDELLPLPRRRLLLIVLAAVVLAVLAARHAAAGGGSRAPTVEPAALRTEAAPKLVVHVVGAVRRPGLYQLPARSRVADAVTKAGGARPSADLSAVNLAAPVADGLQVVVPAREAAAAAGGDEGGGAASSGPVHLNTASVEELDALPGVGPVTTE